MNAEEQATANEEVKPKRVTLSPAKARNTIVKRAFAADGSFYFRMADGSLIKPETAIKRGLIDEKKYYQALKEEQERMKNQ